MVRHRGRGRHRRAAIKVIFRAPACHRGKPRFLVGFKRAKCWQRVALARKTTSLVELNDAGLVLNRSFSSVAREDAQYSASPVRLSPGAAQTLREHARPHQKRRRRGASTGRRCGSTSRRSGVGAAGTPKAPPRSGRAGNQANRRRSSIVPCTRSGRVKSSRCEIRRQGG